MADSDPPGWTGDRRSDGVAVVPVDGAEGRTWRVVVATRPPLLACPCCGKAFITARAAKLVADAYFPVC
jgi:hypothetical protein